MLIVGPAGTGKSTAVRGLAELLPEIDVVSDCHFSCSPSDPCASCLAREEELPVARRRRRIVDLPLNATEDRVAGTVDIARALREGERALEPGLLAEANRGILYVDEINLLDDHLTDILLDAAALGVNVVEREGISISHPARFLLVGTMNEEEGELRPQIADRIGLRVEVEARRRPGGARPRSCGGGRRSPRTRTASRLAWATAEAGTRRGGRGSRALAAGGACAGSPLPGRRTAHGQGGCDEPPRRRDDHRVREGGRGARGPGEVGVEDVVEAASLALGHRLPVDPFAPPPSMEPPIVRRLLEDALELERSKKVAVNPVA